LTGQNQFGAGYLQLPVMSQVVATLEKTLPCRACCRDGRPRRLIPVLAACSLFLSAWLPETLSAGPVYVYREKSGVVRFSSRPPPADIKAEIFTARGRAAGTSGAAWAWSTRGGRHTFQRYRHVIEQAARAHGLEVALIKAVIHAESAFNPTAVSRKGARGLMQLMPDTARLMGVRDSFDPTQNIYGGVRYLASLVTKFGGDMRLALAAYNAGPGAVERHGGVPPFAETRAYVRKVLQLRARYAGPAK